jgi:hypothetical protein
MPLVALLVALLVLTVLERNPNEEPAVETVDTPSTLSFAASAGAAADGSVGVGDDMNEKPLDGTAGVVFSPSNMEGALLS